MGTFYGRNSLASLWALVAALPLCWVHSAHAELRLVPPRGCVGQAVEAALHPDLAPETFRPFLESLPGASDWTTSRWLNTLETLSPEIRAANGGEPLRRAIEKVQTFEQESRRAELTEYYWNVYANEHYFSSVDPKHIDDVRNAVLRAHVDPYDLDHMISDSARGQSAAPALESRPGAVRLTRGLAEFEKIILGKGTVEETVRSLNRWIDSPERAVYFYSRLGEFQKPEELIAGLARENPEFQRLQLVKSDRPSFVTGSFEKETKNPKIADYYIPSNMNERGWSALAPERRFDALYTRFVFEVKPRPGKPRYLGAIAHDAPMLEMRSSLFELDRERLISEVKEISRDMNETHSFHVHLVSDFANDYAHVPEFNTWHKQTNDYLALAGLEEGIHPAGYIKLTRSRGQPEFPGALDQPLSFSKVGKDSYKWQSAGLRAMYGESHIPGYRKIGIELRDVSRKTENWEKYIRQVGSALEDRVWETPTEATRKALADRRTFRLRAAVKGDARSISKYGISEKTIDVLAAIEPNLVFPFLPYESSRFFNYRTGQFVRLNAREIKRVEQARKIFAQDLQNLEREIQRYQTAGQKLDPAHEIKPAIRMSLTEWARRAKVSDFLSGI